ncbi:MAG: alpha-glucuronidase family glycosyl hydrolase, partial [Candidatus Glassbacteria bacterium]
MPNRTCVFTLSLLALALAACSKGKPAAFPVIVAPAGGSFEEVLAAKEIRRYYYLRTGRLLRLVEGLPAAGEGGLIVVGGKARPEVAALLADPVLKAEVQGLKTEEYRLKTVRYEGRPCLLVAGGDEVGTLYGAYRLAERLGVRFYLHGDEVPDSQMAASLPEVDETGRPLFALRGIQPFHDFPEGPDWWDLDGYKAVLSQLPKLRMNFFGLHTYPQGHAGPEPTVWIGLPEDLGPDGTVAFSYPARHFTTLSGTWGYQPEKTSDYAFGADALYERDAYGADYM